MKSLDLIKDLKQAECYLKRVNGSYHMFFSPTTNKIFPVPHPKGNLPIGTVKAIKKAAGINIFYGG